MEQHASPNPAIEVFRKGFFFLSKNNKIDQGSRDDSIDAALQINNLFSFPQWVCLDKRRSLGTTPSTVV